MFGFRALGSRPFENGKESKVRYRGTPHLNRESIIRITSKKTAKQLPNTPYLANRAMERPKHVARHVVDV